MTIYNDPSNQAVRIDTVVVGEAYMCMQHYNIASLETFDPKRDRVSSWVEAFGSTSAVYRSMHEELQIRDFLQSGDILCRELIETSGHNRREG